MAPSPLAAAEREYCRRFVMPDVRVMLYKVVKPTIIVDCCLYRDPCHTMVPTISIEMNEILTSTRLECSNTYSQ